MTKLSRKKAYAGKMAAFALLLSCAALGATASANEEESGTGISSKTSIGITVGSGTSASVTARVNASTTSAFQENKQEIKERFTEIKDDIKERRQAVSGSSTADLNAKLKIERAEFMAELAAKRQAAIAEFKESRENLKSRVEAWKEGMKEKRDEVKIRLDTKVKERVEAHIGIITGRFESIGEKLNGISDRLADRIEALENDGHDMSESVDLLVEADAKLVAAENDIAAVKADLEAELDSETSKESIKANIKAAKDSLKEAYDAYKKTIESIRVVLKADAEAHASTTPSN